MKVSNVQEICEESLIIELKEHYCDMRECHQSLNEMILAVDKCIGVTERVCGEQRSALQDCYEVNNKETLKCSDVVQNFIKCTRSSKDDRLRDIRYICPD